MRTPYDDRTAIWHEGAAQVGEASIEALANNIISFAPTIDAVFIKTSHAGTWMGIRENRPGMAINGRSDISRWITELNKVGLATHVWGLVTGANRSAEIACIVEAATVPGVQSLLIYLDVEGGEFRFSSENDVVQFIAEVRSQIGQELHIGLCVDPQRRWYTPIFPDSWRPYVNSVHPRCFWSPLMQEPEESITEAYVTWGRYDLPIYPVLQGFSTTAINVMEAQDIARGVRGATGLSYWRTGTISPLIYSALTQERVDEALGPDDIIRTYDWEKIVNPDENNFQHGTQTGQPVDEIFQSDTDVRGELFKYTSTRADQDTVWAQWVPRLPSQGTYEVSVYIPDEHATSQNAEYHIHGITGLGTELLVPFNQSKYRNQWVPLVVYQFVEGIDGARINLTNLTGEANRELAFSAFRWRRVVAQRQAEIQQKAIGFDAPIGSEAQRRSATLWPSGYRMTLGFARYYTIVGPAYHTGNDFSYQPNPRAPIYAASDGVVITSAVLRGSWGYVINIRHDPLPDGRVIYTRYAHVESPLVSEGQRVSRGEQIANIGNGNGRFAYHLHYDMLRTDILERNPGHWPGTDYNSLLKNYVDPKQFTQENRPPS